jgi:hypothetical protein
MKMKSMGYLDAQQINVSSDVLHSYTGEKWEYSGAVSYHLFTGFKTTYILVRREILCDIVIELACP